MQQIIAIHGGTTFHSYDEYLSYISNKQVTLDQLVVQPMWKERLQETLGDNYQVLLPKMPNATNARYSEWKRWFENISSLFENDCILIGHSLGAIFLAKYLSENVMNTTVKATILVAAPHSDETTEDLTDFKISSLSDQFPTQAGKLIFFHGTNDPVIAPSEIDRYRKALPTAEFHELSAPDHFVRVEFPEIVETIKSLS